MKKMKYGDPVKVISESIHKGARGHIVNTFSPTMYNVWLEGTSTSIPFYEHELELLNEDFDWGVSIKGEYPKRYCAYCGGRIKDD